MGAVIHRRDFLGSAAAAASLPVLAPLAGSLVFGFATQAAAQGAAPEVTAWVVVQPDERVIIRIARSEMGQGTLTGLAQLVAEELEADWSRVSTEYPTPGQNLAR
jgi:isoquinoline 1-oxidoreductase beta subunit